METMVSMYASVVYGVGFEPSAPAEATSTLVLQGCGNVQSEAEVVAEVIRRALEGSLSKMSRELLMVALKRCEERKP